MFSKYVPLVYESQTENFVAIAIFTTHSLLAEGVRFQSVCLMQQTDVVILLPGFRIPHFNKQIASNVSLS
jgi:hypothetical protein